MTNNIVEVDMERIPFVKDLAANDRPTREKALSSLQTYLAPSRTLNEIDLLKIWKGLFYCIHHTASPLPQQRICASLASLLLSLPAQTFIPFLSAFWKTIGTNFSAIPSLRLDKYLLLIRYYVASSFTYLHQNNWDAAFLQFYLDLIGDSEWGPLTIGGVDGLKNGRGGRVPDGLRYHVLDVWVDGLEAVAETMDEALVREAMKPVQKLAEYGKSKALRMRAKGVIRDERVEAWTREDGSRGLKANSLQPDNQQPDSGEEWEGLGD
ncbi:MAG: hypothetical protein HETSPECPRED_010084 [Heterodermia speciosa]|uniref:Ribosomal RNA-processing protein 1 n=1 Tax=Heterodermia speciosa TaxID=116794 RepID=A0A8H3ERX5_9LECA|nr:MAG: hypothetical protein HETSPECPRED_010084 [Heterodermia speciosa]